MGAIKDITGQRFGRLQAKKMVGTKDNRAQWLCKCDCGNEIYTRADRLKSGGVKSCGCYKKETYAINGSKSYTHKQTGTRLYNIWLSMKSRCNNKNNTRYHDYGGRGITICDEWLNDFASFHKWAMTNGYQDDLTIDRINVDGNYESCNCRWATYGEQAKNRRMNHKINYNGKQLTLKDYAEEIGVSYETLKARLKRGWSLEKTINTPILKR